MDSLSSRQRTVAKVGGSSGISNLKDTRDRVKVGNDSQNEALSANIEELELEVK